MDTWSSDVCSNPEWPLPPAFCRSRSYPYQVTDILHPALRNAFHCFVCVSKLAYVASGTRFSIRRPLCSMHKSYIYLFSDYSSLLNTGQNFSPTKDSAKYEAFQTNLNRIYVHDIEGTQSDDFFCTPVRIIWEELLDDKFQIKNRIKLLTALPIIRIITHNGWCLHAHYSSLRTLRLHSLSGPYFMSGHQAISEWQATWIQLLQICTSIISFNYRL